MENVPAIHCSKNLRAFEQWLQFLAAKGYSNYCQDLNAADFGVAQSRNRCFCVSILGNYSYRFPNTRELTNSLQDYLEPYPEERYYFNTERAKRCISRLLKTGTIRPKNLRSGIDLCDRPRFTHNANAIIARKVGQSDIITGVDIGTSTIATASDNKLTLKELAPKCKNYNKEIKKLSKYLENSRRIANPNKYKPNGTIDENNHDKWIYTRTYSKKVNKLKSIYRKKAAYIKQSHELMINELLADSINFILEDMNFNSFNNF